MTSISIAGGVYNEQCIWPEWNHIYGSGGRAAAALALSMHVDNVKLYAYLEPAIAQIFKGYADLYGFEVIQTSVNQAISFQYIHCLSRPEIFPAVSVIRRNPPIVVEAEVVLRFGMMEGSARVDANCCIYDPQSAFNPEPFEHNGSKTKRLAIVANQSEILALSQCSDVEAGAKKLITQGAEVVVIKSGPAGAIVVYNNDCQKIPAWQSNPVWTIGSGDVFAAVFAARWGVNGDDPFVAAEISSKAVAEYAELRNFPVRKLDDLKDAARNEARTKPGRVYLAGPFFNIGQRWLIDESLGGLKDFGLQVFSPVHDVGRGPAEDVVHKDIEALDSCDRMFAIADGLDAGTLFEIGYARAKGIPVYVLAQSVSMEDLKMVVGTGCKLFNDFVTALHHVAWKS